MLDGDERIDWNTFWAEADDERRAMAATGQYGQAEPLARFMERRGISNSVASIGCGPAHILFELADRYPEVEFVGYDTAESVIVENRERVERTGRDNIAFGVETLPEIEVEHRFELVFSYGTLQYVRTIEQAVESLYELVVDGGDLVFDYPSRTMPATIERAAEDSGEHGEWLRGRFDLVLARENLLSYERIHDLLGRWPRKFNAEGDGPTGSRASPRVFVPK